MQRLLDRLVLVSFLGHLVFGCCWHHAHASPSGAGSSVATTSWPCGHHEEQPADRAHEDHPRQQDCNGERCMFVRAEPVSVGGLSAGMDCVVCARLLPDFPTCGGIDAAGPTLQRPGTPVGLHLLNQAFLL